ncbi:MAG: hypothetical protein OXF03_07705 [Gammaproteobacteria bacterium]|nr:hypothetical protein [Gammaproteobacteria bacterium]MCY4341200.1 hypothetical protein [Gammaproteobacteria bacterium]
MAKGLAPARAVRARRVVLVCGLVAALALAALWLLNKGEAQASPMAYVLCGDDLLDEIRAYRVDLLAGELTNVSEPVEWLGQPHHLAYDPVRSRLYVASMNKKWSPPMWPVTSLRVGGGEFEVAGRFPTNRDGNLLEKARAGEAPPGRKMMAEAMREAYKVIVSPDGRELYVSYGGLSDTGMLVEVWDADTGETLRTLPHAIESRDEWSPNGDYVAEIWPGGDREIDQDGNVIVKKRKGGVSVSSTQTEERLAPKYLEENKGMHPPWGRIEEPLIYLFPRNMSLGEIRVFDRDIGSMISQFKVRELTGLDLGKPSIAVLEGGRQIAVSAVKRTEAPESYPPRSLGFKREGYVVLIDVMDRREVTRTRVGARCTNAVVAYE